MWFHLTDLKSQNKTLRGCCDNCYKSYVGLHWDGRLSDLFNIVTCPSLPFPWVRQNDEDKHGSLFDVCPAALKCNIQNRAFKYARPDLSLRSLTVSVHYVTCSWALLSDLSCVSSAACNCIIKFIKATWNIGLAFKVETQHCK